MPARELRDCEIASLAGKMASEESLEFAEV